MGGEVSLAILIYLLFAIPPAVIVLRMTFAALPKTALPSGLAVRKDENFKPSVAVVIPCFNEGQAVYNTIRSVWESDYPKDKLKIYVQDDGSVDDSYDWILKAAADMDRVYAERNAQNEGKTHTYLRAMDRSQSDIVLIVDSDTLLAPDVIHHMMGCFHDERLGVVGAPLGTINPDHGMLTAMQTYLYFLGLRLAKISEGKFQGVAVIGGYALAVRRVLLEDLAPEIRHRNWFGVPVKDGEDRFITHLALLRGWGTYVEQKAEVRAYAVEDYSQYFGQQLRWKRSLIRTYFWVIRTLPYQVRNLNPAALFGVFSSGTLAIILLMGVITTFAGNPMAFVDPRTFLFLSAAFGAVMIACSLKKGMRDQVLANPLKMVLFMAWFVVNLFYLVLLSFFTLDQDAWGNRDKKTAPAPVPASGD